MLVQTCAKVIYESESENYESAVNLRKFIDKLNGHMCELEFLRQTSNVRGSLITHVINTRNQMSLFYANWIVRLLIAQK